MTQNTFLAAIAAQAVVLIIVILLATRRGFESHSFRFLRGIGLTVL